MRSKKARLKSRAWKLFSEYIRRKYSDKSGHNRCFTCDRLMAWKDSQCGHGISGRGNYVLFLEEVCRPQCPACNVLKGGYYEIFVPKLIDLYTRETFDSWVQEARKPVKMGIGDYNDLIADLETKLAEVEG